MILDVDQIIRFLNKFTIKQNELDEQSDSDAGAAGAGASTTPSGKPVKKWESGRTLGKTYGGPGYKWESGRKDGPTYRFDRKTTWSSGRQMGKTGGSDFA